MAFVESFVEVPVKSGRKQSTTVCEWFVARRDGRPVVQLDTGGSGARQHPGKISQTLQLDEARAKELVAILREAFPSLH